MKNIDLDALLVYPDGDYSKKENRNNDVCMKETELKALLIQAATEGGKAAIRELFSNNAYHTDTSKANVSKAPKEGRLLRGAREAAAYLRISTATFQALKNEGKIKPLYKIGRSFFYNPAELRIVQNLKIYGYGN